MTSNTSTTTTVLPQHRRDDATWCPFSGCTSRSGRCPEGCTHDLPKADTPSVASMFTTGGWVQVELPGGCSGWNDAHDCGREADHPGDHVCAGCHDQWNRGEWDDEEDEGEFFESQRPDVDDRCVSS